MCVSLFLVSHRRPFLIRRCDPVEIQRQHASGLKENRCLLAQLEEDVEIVLAPVNAIGELIMDHNWWDSGIKAQYVQLTRRDSWLADCCNSFGAMEHLCYVRWLGNCGWVLFHSA